MGGEMTRAQQEARDVREKVVLEKATGEAEDLFYAYNFTDEEVGAFYQDIAAKLMQYAAELGVPRTEL
jgi:hypothetical protein